jgi:hypothetical protein
MEETFEHWVNSIKEYLDEFGEIWFTQTDSKNSGLFKIRLLKDPCRIEFYKDDSEKPISIKKYTSMEGFFNLLVDKVYQHPEPSFPDYYEKTMGNYRYFLFQLSKGYPRDFDMKRYTAEIEQTIDHINTTHNKHSFNIAGVEIFSDSFELKVKGDYPGWQMHFVLYLVDKTDLKRFRDDRGSKNVLSYTEIE